jgi:hypothetical protein
MLTSFQWMDGSSLSEASHCLKRGSTRAVDGHDETERCDSSEPISGSALFCECEASHDAVRDVEFAKTINVNVIQPNGLKNRRRFHDCPRPSARADTITNVRKATLHFDERRNFRFRVASCSTLEQSRLHQQYQCNDQHNAHAEKRSASDDVQTHVGAI